MACRRFVADRGELRAAGFRCSQIDCWIRTGRLIKIVRSVYSYGRDVESPEAVRRAALLAAGSGSALIGRSACESWGIVKPRLGLPSLVEVGAPFGRARSLPGLSPALRRTAIEVSRRSFESNDIRYRDGIYVARPALALIDFAARANDRDLRFAFLEACRLDLFDGADLTYCFTRLVGRRGAKALRPYLVLWVPELKRIRSVLEGWFLLVWVDRGLPMPKVNEKAFGYELDCYWPDQRFALELDGDAFHNDPIQKQLDLKKQRDLEAHGLTVRRMTYRQFEADPEANVDRIARALGFGPN